MSTFCIKKHIEQEGTKGKPNLRCVCEREREREREIKD